MKIHFILFFLLISFSCKREKKGNFKSKKLINEDKYSKVEEYMRVIDSLYSDESKLIKFKDSALFVKTFQNKVQLNKVKNLSYNDDIHEILIDKYKWENSQDCYFGDQIISESDSSKFVLGGIKGWGLDQVYKTPSCFIILYSTSMGLLKYIPVKDSVYPLCDIDYKNFVQIITRKRGHYIYNFVFETLGAGTWGYNSIWLRVDKFDLNNANVLTDILNAHKIELYYSGKDNNGGYIDVFNHISFDWTEWQIIVKYENGSIKTFDIP